MATIKDVKLVKELLRDSGAKAKQEGIYGIWSWIDKDNAAQNYEIFYSIGESNDFEFNQSSFITEKKMLYENGTMKSYGFELIDTE